MAKTKLTLVPSISMDSNKKKDRNEDGLIRLPKNSRQYLNTDDQAGVEVYSDTGGTEHRIKSAKLLSIFKAFSKDISDYKDRPPNEAECVGFVTTKTFKAITNDLQNADIWVAGNVNDTVIGADPEFLLFDHDGCVVRANNVLNYNGELGCDGAMAEVRPKPSVSPEGLVANITDILKNTNLTEAISEYNWVAGCYYKDGARDYPIGGHIHIGNPVQILNIPSESRQLFFIVFNKIIDELLAIPMVKLDGATKGSARRTKCTMGQYGYYGGWRLCNGRLEHRTLSGLWLMHPTLATCVLGTVKAIIDEVFRLVLDTKLSMNYICPTGLRGANFWNTTFDSWKEIPLAVDMKCTADSQYMIDFLHKSNAGRVNLTFVNRWLDNMRTMSTYNTYAKYIDGFAEMLKIGHGEFAKFDKSLQKNWLEGKKFIIDF